MRKIALLSIIALAIIAFLANDKLFAQDLEQLTVNQRIQKLESNLNSNKKIYKIIGENKVKGNGKIIQNITSPESFEILAMPLIEPSNTNGYPQEFEAKMFTENGLTISEAKSLTGIRMKAEIPEENTNPRKHSFEFINPNALPVKVRFYFVQDKKN